MAAEELKKVERDIKKEVDTAVESAKNAPYPPVEWMWRNMWVSLLRPCSFTLCCAIAMSWKLPFAMLWAEAQVEPGMALCHVFA
jgi:hypothetical protein